MKKTLKPTVKSSPSVITSGPAATSAFDEEIASSVLDALTVKILSLRLSHSDPREYIIKVVFFNQIIVASTVKPIFSRTKEDKHVRAEGTFNYDPSDYEKMCLLADCPLLVYVQPHEPHPGSETSQLDSLDLQLQPEDTTELSCCTVDILQMFTTLDKMCVMKRMEPTTLPPSPLHSISWDNLPLVSIELSVDRHEQNAAHHEFLKNANSIKMTMVGIYGLQFPFNKDINYTSSTVLPVYNETGSLPMLYNDGYEVPSRFNCTKFYPKWESLRQQGMSFTRSDDKLLWTLEDIKNDSNIDLERYLYMNKNTAVWGSFHRSLVLGRCQRSMWKQVRRWRWPLEVHLPLTEPPGFGYSYMAFLDLFPLLYPGARRLCLAVPLSWYDPIEMMENCNCSPVLPALQPPRTSLLAMSQDTNITDNQTFVIVEVVMGKPMVPEHIPPHISGKEMMEMLREMEQSHVKRHCTGRGQSDRDWKATVSHAVDSLRRVPHHGLTEYCIFNRQLSETRTRVEILNSFWMDSAVYINNNFVVEDFLDDDKKFEELLMIAHVNLMRIAYDHLVGPDTWLTSQPTLRAARQARHLLDTQHAMELYMQEVATAPHNEDVWRELGTCLRDVDRDWAAVCINKAFLLDIRHPLSLLSKANLVYEEDPDGAELFFRALIHLYQFWGTAWVITSAYFHTRELFNMADQVLKYYRLTLEDHQQQGLSSPRAWNHELGDWWDPPPLLPGMSPYYDAADILLRLRAISLAEVCVSLALVDEGESAVYYHMVGLCCRLRGQIEDALCHAQQGISIFGEVNYLRSLEGACLHLLDQPKEAMAAFDKAGANQGPYSTLLSLERWEQPRIRPVLVDLLRRQPNAYGWMALANDWMTRAATEDAPGDTRAELEEAAHVCAAACAVQALNWDRRAGRAWALLSRLAKPDAARAFYAQMATQCGYQWVKCPRERTQSPCHRLGRALRRCRCRLCDILTA